MTLTPELVAEVAGKRCETCRWWDRLSINSNKGDCRAPGGQSGHRFWRVPITDASGNVESYAMMDSFGPAETRYDDKCSAWAEGQPDGPIDVRDYINGVKP